MPANTPTTACQTTAASNGSFDWSCDGTLEYCQRRCTGAGQCSCTDVTVKVGTQTFAGKCSNQTTYAPDLSAYYAGWTTDAIMPSLPPTCTGAAQPPTCGGFTTQAACTGSATGSQSTHYYFASCSDAKPCGVMAVCGDDTPRTCASPCGKALTPLSCFWSGGRCLANTGASTGCSAAAKTFARD